MVFFIKFQVRWLASWYEEVQGVFRFMMLSKVMLDNAKLLPYFFSYMVGFFFRSQTVPKILLVFAPDNNPIRSLEISNFQ